MIEFSLTVQWPSTPEISVTKSFDTDHKKRAWSLAKRWRENCLAICGKNHKGESWVTNSLEIVPNKKS